MFTDLSSVAEEGNGVARVEGSQLVTPTSMEPDQLVTLDSILTSNMWSSGRGWELNTRPWLNSVEA